MSGADEKIHAASPISNLLIRTRCRVCVEPKAVFRLIVGQSYTATDYSLDDLLILTTEAIMDQLLRDGLIDCLIDWFIMGTP